MDNKEDGPKPLTTTESTKLDALLALVNDDPDAPITMTARTLCAYLRAQLAAKDEAIAEARRIFDAIWMDAEYDSCVFCHRVQVLVSAPDHDAGCELSAWLAKHGATEGDDR